MRSKFEIFDRSQLRIKPLAERQNGLEAGWWLALDDPTPPFEHPDLGAVARRLEARRKSCLSFLRR